MPIKPEIEGEPRAKATHIYTHKYTHMYTHKFVCMYLHMYICDDITRNRGRSQSRSKIYA